MMENDTDWHGLTSSAQRYSVVCEGGTPQRVPRYIVITGGVISGSGKGVTASSIGALLQGHDCRVTAIKIDPYLNQDSGTLSPFEHGETFVLNDGGEADLDLGNYERFLGKHLTRQNSITTGKIYRKVLEAERRGDYLGATIQIVPHITNTIVEWITQVGSKDDHDVCIIELGGTVGDIESLPFLEALRQLTGDAIVCHVHVSYIPVLKTTNELKTKPTQTSVQNVRRYGLTPDFLCLRCEAPIPDGIVSKLSRLCGIPATRIIKNVDVSNIYKVPISFLPYLHPLWNMLLLPKQPIATERWTEWTTVAEEFNQLTTPVRIAIVGKYSGLRDSYISLIHAIKHAARINLRAAHIEFIESTTFTDPTTLSEYDGVIIPGGFGQRGIQGMILAANYTRTHNIPTLGICLGMQIMVIELARNELCLANANSAEFDPDTEHPLLIIMEPEQRELGGTMRLGLQDINIKPDTVAASIYNATTIAERHRHRFEVNPDYHQRLLSIQGVELAAFDVSGHRVEILEHQSHPFYIGCQYHPEFLTWPNKPHRLFAAFIKAALSTHSAGLF